MNIKIIHFYPDLMSLYGSYANVALLKRQLEQLGNTVSVEIVQPGKEANLTDADFLFMGAGTERAQKAALTDFLRFDAAVKDLAARDVPMLFCGTAMELLGKTITDAEGKVYRGIGLGSFASVQGGRRFVEDVLGRTALYEDAVVGFMNKCSTISGVETPLLDTLELGYGNDGAKTAEGFRFQNVLGSHLTGPILVKNPRLLQAVIGTIYSHRKEPMPKDLPAEPYAEAGWAITAEQLALRAKI